MVQRDLPAAGAVEPETRGRNTGAWVRVDDGAVRNRAWVVARPPRDSGGRAGRPCFEPGEWPS